jgi:hypothetical protein
MRDYRGGIQLAIGVAYDVSRLTVVVGRRVDLVSVDFLNKDFPENYEQEISCLRHL